MFSIGVSNKLFWRRALFYALTKSLQFSMYVWNKYLDGNDSIKPRNKKNNRYNH